MAKKPVKKDKGNDLIAKYREERHKSLSTEELKNIVLDCAEGRTFGKKASEETANENSIGFTKCILYGLDKKTKGQLRM